MTVIIRQICQEDAEGFGQLQRQLDEETRFMLFEPGERVTSTEEQIKRIGMILATENQMIFVAESDSRLIGFLATFGGQMNRNRHCAHVVIGILDGYQGQGIGTQLFATMEKWVRERGIHRLELTVMTHNEAGIALYKKMGFQIEGTKPHCLQVDGVYVDEHVMGKLL